MLSFMFFIFCVFLFSKYSTCFLICQAFLFFIFITLITIVFFSFQKYKLTIWISSILFFAIFSFCVFFACYFSLLFSRLINLFILYKQNLFFKNKCTILLFILLFTTYLFIFFSCLFSKYTICFSKTKKTEQMICTSALSSQIQ